MILCTKCHQEKDESKFYDNKLKRNGKQSWCIKCMKEYNKDNFEGHRNRQLRYNYGISHQEYMDRLEEQNYECAACGDSWLEEESNKNWPVDHDHKTKIIRGIVCERCNHCIGHAYDSADRLDRIANYLRKNEQL